MPTTTPPTAATMATARRGRGSIFGSSRPADRGPDVRDSWMARSLVVGGSLRRDLAPPRAEREPAVGTRRNVNGALSVCRVAYGRHHAGSTEGRTRWLSGGGHAEAPDGARCRV